MSKSGGSKGREQSFTDVLNSLGNAPPRSRGHLPEEPPAEQPAIPWLPTARSATEPGAERVQWQTGNEEWGEPEDFASAVRPYTWTRGRTRPVYDLAIETLVSTSAQGRDVTALTSVEHRAVAELCCAPRSVAEVAALLGLPLGVARVLLADMADIRLVVVHRNACSSGDVPEFGFMERVLSGLRRL
ncbi:MAG: DUF742 domain-containing protein [Pseudonocardiaceae bacterium]